MSSPFITEPVALWEYLSLHTRHKNAANTTTKHPYTPNSSQTVTEINGTESSWNYKYCFSLSRQTTGAQMTILRGNASSSPIHCCDVTKPPYLISGELFTSPLHCFRTPCAVGAPSSSSLCSEHINQTQWTAVVGDVTSPTSDTMCHSCAPVHQTNATLPHPSNTATGEFVFISNGFRMTNNNTLASIAPQATDIYIYIYIYIYIIFQFQGIFR